MADNAGEFRFQGPQFLDPRVHVGQMGRCNPVGIGTGAFGVATKLDQFPDGLHGKPEITGVADETQAAQGVGPVTPLVALRAFGRVQKAGLLVIADRRHLDVGRTGQLSDTQHFGHFSLEPLVTREFTLDSSAVKGRSLTGEKTRFWPKMSGCCDNTVKFDGLSADYKRRLWVVIAINAAMFAVEMIAGHMAGSQALQADALDFFGDAVTYGLSLAVIGAPLTVRATAALVKGISLMVMGGWVLGSTVYHVLILGVPRAEIMGAVALLALAANMASVLILARYKDGDANVRSVWLCSRNDAIGNLAVVIAALGVWGTASGWPDLVVAAAMAALFLNSALQILRQGLSEYRAGRQGGTQASDIIAGE